jgi:hypothetical protein
MLFSVRQIAPNPPALAQDYPADLFEAWVIFDGSDGTSEIASNLGAQVLVTPTNGNGSTARSTRFHARHRGRTPTHRR